MYDNLFAQIKVSKMVLLDYVDSIIDTYPSSYYQHIERFIWNGVQIHFSDDNTRKFR